MLRGMQRNSQVRSVHSMPACQLKMRLEELKRKPRLFSDGILFIVGLPYSLNTRPANRLDSGSVAVVLCSAQTRAFSTLPWDAILLPGPRKHATRRTCRIHKPTATSQRPSCIFLNSIDTCFNIWTLEAGRACCTAPKPTSSRSSRGTFTQLNHDGILRSRSPSCVSVTLHAVKRSQQ